MSADEGFIPGIYIIKNTKNGKVYIGSSIDTTRRWEGHKDQLCAGKHGNHQLQYDWGTYGSAAFTFGLLEETDANYQLGDAESFWYNVYLEEGNELYNLIPPCRAKTPDEVHQEEIEVEWPDHSIDRPEWHAWVYGGAKNPRL